MRGRGGPRDSSSSRRGFGGYSSGTERGRGARGHWSGQGGYMGTHGGRGAFAAPHGHEFGPPPRGFPRGRGFRGSGEQVGGRRGSGMPFRGGFSSRSRGQEYSAVNKRVYSEEPRVYLWKLTDDINEDHLKEHFSKFGEIKDVFIALSAGGTIRVGYALLYPATMEIVESIVNSSPHTIHSTTLTASYPRESMPMAKRWREQEAEELSHDSHMTQPEGDTFQDVGNADDHISDASLTIDCDDTAEHCPEQGGEEAMQVRGEAKSSSATQEETVVSTSSLPFDGKMVQPLNEESETKPSPVDGSEGTTKRHSPRHDERKEKPSESAQKEEEDAKQGKDESTSEHRSSSERGRTSRSDHRDRRGRMDRRQRSRSRELRRRSPSPREERSRFGVRRGGRHSPPSGGSDRSSRSRRPLSASGARPRAGSRWDSDDRTENRSRQSFPPSQDNKQYRDFNSQGRGRPRDYTRPGPRSSMGPQPIGPGPMGPEPTGPGPMGQGLGGSFNSPPWGRKTLLPTPPVPPNEDSSIPPPGQGGPASNYPLHDAPPDEGSWNRRDSVGHGYADQHYSGPPPDHQGRPFDRESFRSGPPFPERGPPPPQAHHPPDSSWQNHGSGPTQQPSFGGGASQQQPPAPPGWQPHEMSSRGIQDSSYRSESQHDHRGHQQGLFSDSHPQPGGVKPSAPGHPYDEMQHKYAGLHPGYQGQPAQGYTAQGGNIPPENYGVQQQNFDGQQTSHGRQQQPFGSRQPNFERQPSLSYSGQWGSNDQGPHYDGYRQCFDQPQGQQQSFGVQQQRFDAQQQGFYGQQQQRDGEQQRYEGQQPRYDGPEQGFDGQQRRFDGQQQRYEGQQPRYEGQQPRYEGQQPRYEGQQPRYEGQQPRYEGQQQRYEGQQPRYEGQQQRYEGQQLRYDGQQQRYDDQQQRYEGQQQRYEGQQQRYEGQQQRYEGQQPIYKGQQPRYEGQQQRYEGQQQRYEGQQTRYEGQQQHFVGPEPRPDGRQPAYSQSQQSMHPHHGHHQPNLGQPQQEYGRGRDATPTSQPTHPHQQGEYISDSKVGQRPPQPSGPSAQGPPYTRYNEEGWRHQQEGHPPTSHPSSLFPPSRGNQEDYETRVNQYSHPAPQQGYRSVPNQAAQGSHGATIPASAHGNIRTMYGEYQGDNTVKYNQYQGSLRPLADARESGGSHFREERPQGGNVQYGRPQPHKPEWQSHDQRVNRSQPPHDWSAAPSSRPQEHTQPTPDVGYMPAAPPAGKEQGVPKIDTKALQALLADSDNIYSAYIKRAKSQD